MIRDNLEGIEDEAEESGNRKETMRVEDSGWAFNKFRGFANCHKFKELLEADCATICNHFGGYPCNWQFYPIRLGYGIFMDKILAGAKSIG